MDRVRGDREWQRYLREIDEAQRTVSNDDKDELFKFANPHNVTPEEIAIDEKYDPKMQAAEVEPDSLPAKLGSLQNMRTMSANCPSTPRTISYEPNLQLKFGHLPGLQCV